MITFGTPTTAHNTGGLSVIAVDKPLDVQDGDVLLALVTQQATSSLSCAWTPPAGWTSTGAHNDAMTSASHFHAFYHGVTDAGSLGSSFSFTSNRGGDMTVQCVRVRGAYAADPIDAFGLNGASANGALGTAVTITGFTTTTPDCMWVSVMSARHDPTVTWGGSQTALGRVASTHATSSSRTMSAWSYLQIAGAGAQADQTATLSASRDWRASAFALVPFATSADAGDDQVVEAGEYVTLDGSDSLDADTFEWTQDPTDPVDVILDATDEAIVHFYAPRGTPGGDPIALDFTLTVNGTETDQVAITVNAPPNPAPPLNLKVNSSGTWG